MRLYGAYQRVASSVMAMRRSPSGVESAPVAVEGTSTKPGNSFATSSPGVQPSERWPRRLANAAEEDGASVVV
jgi:hypothetical protein